eukprot:1589628-Rhodomonas_salina.3
MPCRQNHTATHHRTHPPGQFRASSCACRDGGVRTRVDGDCDDRSLEEQHASQYWAFRSTRIGR